MASLLASTVIPRDISLLPQYQNRFITSLEGQPKEDSKILSSVKLFALRNSKSCGLASDIQSLSVSGASLKNSNSSAALLLLSKKSSVRGIHSSISIGSKFRGTVSESQDRPSTFEVSTFCQRIPSLPPIRRPFQLFEKKLKRSYSTGVVSSSARGGDMAKEPQKGDEGQKFFSPKRNSEGLRTELYQHMEPYRTGHLRVSDLHQIYWEESGNPVGKPVLFLHGGPGGGTAPANRRFFDSGFYRIILMDQRGSGKSIPHATVEENTTWDLVSDVEQLRKELKIESWLVFGGSWGSTLSLSYAETHPDRVRGLVLRGIFLLRKKEIDWFYQSGADSVYPDAWEAYRDFIPVEERGDFVAAYHKRLMDESNPDVQMAAAKAWTGWEMATSYLIPNEDSVKRGEDSKFALAFAKIENHYFYNKGFFETDSWILENAHRIRHIPGVIVQGRYDVVCPMMSAWDLHRAWPEATLKIVTNAGHSANEPGISGELVAAMEKFKTL